MNTTMVDGVKIKQGDEVECSDYSISGWAKSVFIADLGEGYTCRYITTLDTNLDSFIANKYIRPIHKKQCVPLTQEDILTKYPNGWIREKEHPEFIQKITAMSDRQVFYGSLNNSYGYLKEHYEISADGIKWDKCEKEV